MSIFITLNPSPILIQGQPNNLNQNCFPVESNAETLVCLDNTVASEGTNDTQDLASSVSTQNQSSVQGSNQNCFPVESNAETLVCLDNTVASGGAESSEDTD